MKRALALALLLSCSAPPTPWQWVLPPGFPTPSVPADNPMSVEKVELGRLLFNDVALSRNQTQSCASCHQADKAFSDGRANAVGSTGENHRRNAMALLNPAYFTTYTWANPLMSSLEKQALVPLFGETPVELGWSGHEAELLARLSTSVDYRQGFQRAFAEERDPVSLSTLTKALAAYERSILQGHSAYDAFRSGDTQALSASAQRGLTLFFSERLECTHCHGGFNFADAVAHDGTVNREMPFHNTGLYNDDGVGAYPKRDQGLIEITLQPQDMGRFRAPSLRNVALTAPYMHDGSVATLSDAIDHYAVGGRASRTTGTRSPLQSEFVRGFTLTPDEKADLLAFLESLTERP